MSSYKAAEKGPSASLDTKPESYDVQAVRLRSRVPCPPGIWTFLRSMTGRMPAALASSPVPMETEVSTTRRAAVAAGPAMLLAAVLLLPFAGKAFTIDDTLFLREAEQSLRDPVHPSTAIVVWSESFDPVRLSQVMPNGPLMGWLLVPAILAGGSEFVAHLLQVLLLAVAAFETAALALRLGFDDELARLASLLLVATPTVLGMAGTAMPDVAAMTFSLVGIERLYAWRSDARLVDGAVAAVMLGLAPLARSHVLLLLGLSPFVLGLPTSPSQLKRWWPVVAAAVLTSALLVLTRDPVGSSTDLARSAGLFSSLGNVRSNSIAFGTHVVLLLPVGLAWMVGRGRRFWLSPLPWIGLTAAVGVLVYGGETRWLWLAPVCGFGFAVVADLARDAAARRDSAHAVLALWILVALPIVVYLHFPSKYLVPCAPAAAILASTALAALPRRAAVASAGTLVAAGALFGVLILRADEVFAGLGRRAVEELVEPRVAAGDKVWFNAHWGFQWYAERAGAHCVTTSQPHPQRGDYVVSAEVTITGVPIEAFRGRELVATIADDAPGGRIVSSADGAGFYSNGWGYLPWVWSSRPVDRFQLWRIR
jgi:4-amino-4-deoxy-L-arabinose transferase-like glycosyltransferase